MKAWIIRNDSGTLMLPYIGKNRRKVIQAFMENEAASATWAEVEAARYRCIRVTINKEQTQ